MHSPAARWRGQKREISRLDAGEKAQGQPDSTRGGTGRWREGRIHQNSSTLSTYYVLVEVLSYHIEPPEYPARGPHFSLCYSDSYRC